MSRTAKMTAVLGLSVYAVVLLLTPCSNGETRFDHRDNPYWDNFTYLKIQDPEFTKIMDISTNEVNMLLRFETSLADNNIKVQKNTTAYGQFLENMPTQNNRDDARYAEIHLKAAQYLKAKYCSGYGASDFVCAEQLSHLKIPKHPFGLKCAEMFYNQRLQEDCVSSSYRSADGYCNNLVFKARGQGNTPYKRLLFPEYEDGLNTIKVLPNVRQLSVALVTRKCSLNKEKTMSMAIWAAFIGHDMTHTAISTTLNTNESVVCCDANGAKLIPRYTHPSCAPIEIAKNDSIYSIPRCTCMNYVRSMPTMRMDCTFGPREQLNQATHFLDGSALYGSNAKRMRALRDSSSGRGQLLVRLVEPATHYLPDLVRGPCSAVDAACARTGGDGGNAHPMLTSMYTVWTREHNRIAKELSYLNGHWSDDKVFDEARKIVTAIIQHITYTEWLPAMIGDEHYLTGPLELYHKTGQSYDWTVDPGVSQAFAVGVLQPIIHSMMSDVVKFYHDNGTEKGCMSLKMYYSKSRAVQMEFTDPILRGMTLQNVQNVGMSFTKYSTNFLYSNPHDSKLGMDRLALDIHRGRDHGLPSYAKFRKLCGLPPIENWRDVGHAMRNIDVMEQLKQLYKSWDDIDLIVGMLMERYLANSIIGPTAACIIKEQFIRTKLGDRHFYDQPGIMFTNDKLSEIKRMTLGRVMCDNSHEFPKIQFSVFDKPTTASQFFPCYITSLVPRMNLEYWRETNPGSTTKP